MALPHESVEDDESVSDGIVWLERDEARAYFDQTARELLGMSGEKFLRRLDSGEWHELIDDGEHNDHFWLAMMRRSFVRQNTTRGCGRSGPAHARSCALCDR